MVSNLGESPMVNRATISVVDKRTHEQKQSRRDSINSPIAVLGDENVQPPAIVYLQSSLQKYQKQPQFITIEIEEFHIIDFFPKRIRIATSSVNFGLTAAISNAIINQKTDCAFIDKIGVPINEDSIVCLFSGIVNGKKIYVAAYHQYEVSLFAISVRNDSAFRNAVKVAIDKAAEDIMSQVEK